MRAVLSYMGFTESPQKRCGTEDLYFNVVRKFASDDIATKWPDMWTHDTNETAIQLSRLRITSIAIVAYSHGQEAACDLSRACYDLGIDTDLMLLCDPVYRPSWLPRINAAQPLAFRAITRFAKIKVPRNVKRVASVRQRVNRPHGHDLVATSPDTVIVPPIELKFTHAEIDSAGAWFELVDRELTTWANTI